MTSSRYAKPGFFTARVFDPTVALLVRRFGIDLKGARVLSVRGRTSGRWHGTPVNPLNLAGHRYLVAPRGQTQWVRNLRVSGEGRLTRGRRTETVRAVEIADEDKPPVLRAYLRRWAWQVKPFFGGLDADSPDDALARVASEYPVFRIVSL